MLSSLITPMARPGKRLFEAYTARGKNGLASGDYLWLPWMISSGRLSWPRTTR